MSEADHPQQQLANGTAALESGHHEAEQQNENGFRALDVDTVKDYLASIPHLAEKLGPVSGASQWQVQSECMS